jgi:hypothetical protein
LTHREKPVRTKFALPKCNSYRYTAQSYVAPDALLSLVDAVHAPVGVLRDDTARRLLLISTSKRWASAR